MNTKNIFILLFTFLTIQTFAQKFELTGEIRPRFESRHGFAEPIDSGQFAGNFISQRTRLTFKFENKKVRLGASLQNVRVWGESSTMAANDINLSFHEAWAEALLTKKVSMKMGRQEIVYDDHRIFGTVGWAQQARSHDAFIFKIKPNDKHKFDIGLAFNANSQINVDTLLYDNVAGYKAFQYLWYHGKFDKVGLSFLLLNTNKEFLDESDSTDVARTIDNMITAGPRLTYKKDKISIDAASYLQLGKSENTDVNSLYFGANFGYKINDNYTVKAGVDYLSGKDQNDTENEINSFKPLFGTNHKFNGWMDYFYVGNHNNSVGLIDINFTLAYKKDKFSAKVVPHLFSAAADVYDGADVMDSSLGTEIDLLATYKISDDINVKGGFSLMLATETMEALKGGNVDENNYWTWIMFTFKPQLFLFDK